MAELTPLKQFLSRHSHIRHATPSSPDFSSLSSVFVMNYALQPSMVVRPQSADDVVGLLSIIISHSIPFTVRVGGHDPFSRSMVNDSVTIDMRDIAYVSIDKDSMSARVGGGIIKKDLCRQLAKEDVMTPTGLINHVGYVGWATHGGYGMQSPKYGMGVDQILGAKIVNEEGKVVDADEELLKGIRGGGGAFGVIVELTIKIYPSTGVLGGAIFFQSDNFQSTMEQFNDGYRALSAEGLPPSLGLHQAALNLPQGKSFASIFLWSSSDHEQGDIWLKKVCSLAPLAMHTVVQTTASEWLDETSALVPESTFAEIMPVSFKKLTPEVVDVFATFAEELPTDPSTMFNFHELKGLPTQSYPDSVFPERQPHFLAEILPMAATAERQENAAKWARKLQEAVLKTDPNNLLPTRYISFADPKTLNMREIFNDRYEALAKLKQTYDPQNVFKSALAQF